MAGTYTQVTYYSPLNFTGTHLALMDPEGEVRWSHELGSVGIDTEVQWADGLVFFGGGGFTGTGTVGMVDLAGNQVYKAPPWDTLWDHHAELREDGTLFGLAIDTVQVGPRQHTGFELVHWDPLTDEILWEWQSIQGVQDGPLTMEYAHANWATLVDEGDTQAAYVSLCATQQLVRIDVETKEIQWILGTGQDMALVDSDGAPLPDSEFPQCQHGVDRQGDRWLMMDNGRQREQSRGLELVLDQEAMTATLSWEWTREGWFNDILGDADYLGQDHVLLLNGVAAGLGEKPWLAEVDMPSGDIVWQAEFTSQAWVYRADRLGGCEAFANERYCPELVDELRGGPVLP